VRRDQLAFLVGGLLFGILIGAAGYDMVSSSRKQARAAATGQIARQGGQGQAQNAAPAQGAQAAAGAPMMQEIAELKAHLAQHPDDPATLTRLANLYHDASMWPQAIEYYNRALEVLPEDPNVITDLGVCHQAQGEFDIALDLFARANEIAPDHWQSLYNIAVVGGLYTGKFDLADAALTRLEEMRAAPPQVQRLREEVERAKAAAGAAGNPS
jgi:tetratricopeptide (TPR) repeat protein